MNFDPALLAFCGGTPASSERISRAPDAGSSRDQVFGRIGGMVRRDNMTPEARSESARKAALSRWAGKKK